MDYRSGHQGQRRSGLAQEGPRCRTGSGEPGLNKSYFFTQSILI